MNGHANIDAIEATEHLKNILNVGKSETDSAKLRAIANDNMETSEDGILTIHEQAYQKIDLCADKDSSHVIISGTDVDIYSSPLGYGATCSQVLVDDLVTYGWEEKNYSGKLVSVHLSGLYYAYVLRPANNKPGFVRVVRRHLDLRYLIKDYKTEVKDVSFAHTTAHVLLGSVDAHGELLIHKISDDGNIISCNLLLRILRPENWTFSEHNRIIWCLYIPDDNETNEDGTPSEDVTNLLVVTHDERAEIWNIETIINEHGHGNLTIDEVKVGVQVISDVKMPISSATFSPDGTALAIGSLDGKVNFFQVSTLEKNISPRCLHQWTPHPEKSLSSFYFLDNHRNHRPDIQFWKFAITGADNNTELKVWSCETWTCLQTIRIHPNPDDAVVPCLKAEMDLSSKYLFLSDIKRKILLILYIEQDPGSSNIVISSVSEYRVPLPVLSLAIASIGYSRVHALAGNKNSDDEGDGDQIGDVLNDADDTFSKYIIKLFWIQTKTLQYCRILYNPKQLSPLPSIGSVSSLSQESFVFKDGLSDISIDSQNTSARSLKDLDITFASKSLCIIDEPLPTAPALPSHLSSFPSEVLLTPDDFTSPSHSNLSSAHNSFTQPPTVEEVKCDSLPVDAGSFQRRKSSQHSTTSSPSREVAEILAPTKVLHMDEMVNNGVVIKNEVDIESNSLGSFNVRAPSGSPRNQSDYLLKDWPQAPPDPTKDYIISPRNDSVQNHQQHFHANNVDTTAADVNVKFSMLNENFSELMHKMNVVIEVIQTQAQKIQGLQCDIKALHEGQKHNHLNAKESAVNKIEHAISHNLVPQYTRLENLFLKKAEEERKRSEREHVRMTEEISATFSTKLENTLKKELANSIVPQINGVLDAVGQKMQLDFTQKLSLTDNNLRDNLSKHLKSKAFTDSMSQTLATLIPSVIQSACRDVFQNHVVPSFDKACHLLFQQLNEIFSKGTSEYMEFLEKNSIKTSSSIDTLLAHLQEEVNKIVSGATQTVQAQSAKATNHIVDVMKQQETLVSDLRVTLQEEVRKAMREQTNAVLNSRSTTPVPLSDPQLMKNQLLQLVKQGNINDAFQQALSVMDVQLVLFLCESVSIEQVFGPNPCPLQQHVLLSLVNQLSADLSVKTDTKVKYIEDVIASLDRNDPIIKDHIVGVLEILQQRINLFLSKFPNHRLARNFRMISLVINSLRK